MLEYEIEALNADVVRAQKTREFPQHSFEREEQGLGALELEIELEVNVIPRR